MTQNCILILGGSFDPVHNGHVEIGRYFCRIFNTDRLRLIPTGNPWQKTGLQASAEDRIAMLERAFTDTDIQATIDRQEIERSGATYSVDTLNAIRQELGEQTSLVFLMGADQLHGLNTWHRWHDLLTLSNFAVMSRPGFPEPLKNLPSEVAETILPKLAEPATLTTTPAGKVYVDTSLRIDISSTAIRNRLQNRQNPEALIPPAVLDYINAHKLYRN